MNKKESTHILTVRFTEEEKAMMAQLRSGFGLSSDNEVLRFALRSALRELEQLRAQAKHASPRA